MRVSEIRTFRNHHRQRQIAKARWALAHVGMVIVKQTVLYQLKRAAAKLLLELEMEHGQAIHFALSVVHPFTVPAQLPSALVHGLHPTPNQPIGRRGTSSG